MMNTRELTEFLPPLLIGVCMILKGLLSNPLISESDVPATEEEKAQFKATPGRRRLVVLGGLASIIYSLTLLHH